MDLEQRRTDLLLDKRAREFNAFEFEGVMYRGFYPQAVAEFVHIKPCPGDFHEWLKKNYADRVMVMEREVVNE